MDLRLFDEVAAFLDARLDDESANRTGRYASRAEAFKDIEAKVRIMNRAYEARDLVRSFPDDVGAESVLAATGRSCATSPRSTTATPTTSTPGGPKTCRGHRDTTAARSDMITTCFHPRSPQFPCTPELRISAPKSRLVTQT